MNQDVVISLAMQAMSLAMKVALPLLLAGLVVGLLVSIFQAVTQIQEMTLAFIPKILAIAVVMIVAGPLMLGQIVSYTARGRQPLSISILDLIFRGLSVHGYWLNLWLEGTPRDTVAPTYRELAAYYGTTVIPARLRRPQGTR